MIHRYRNPQMVERMENDLKTYQETKEPASIIWIIKQANDSGLHYDLDTIEYLLDLFPNRKGVAIAIFDELYPLTGEEAKNICKARRRYAKTSGIIA